MSAGRGAGGSSGRVALAPLPLRVVQFLLEATLDLAALASNGGAVALHEHDADAHAVMAEQWAAAVENAESAAGVVQQLLERGEQRRLSISGQ